MTTNNQAQVLGKVVANTAKAHENRTDKAGRPYILHCLAVMGFLAADYPDDYELMQGGVAHDDFEDTKVTKQDLRNLGCTERTIAMVTAMTRMPGQTEEEYQEQVLANPDAIKIKMADIRHNSDIRRLKGLTQKDFDRAVKYQKFFVRLREASVYARYS